MMNNVMIRLLHKRWKEIFHTTAMLALIPYRNFDT